MTRPTRLRRSSSVAAPDEPPSVRVNPLIFSVLAITAVHPDGAPDRHPVTPVSRLAAANPSKGTLPHWPFCPPSGQRPEIQAPIQAFSGPYRPFLQTLTLRELHNISS